MTIRYPNGKVYQAGISTTNTTVTKKNSYSNRGMTLEEDLNDSNTYYLERQIAVIHKKPTPVQIVKVDYPSRSAAVIREAYFKQASTTDYNGIYRGRYLDFEAKETKNSTSFPLQNFHQHQINHMENVLNQNGICFVILRFSQSEEIFFLDAIHLINFWNRQANGGRKSVTKLEVQEVGIPITLGFQPRIPYISIIERYYF